MPFRSGLFVGTYNPQQFSAMQEAYRETYRQLGRTTQSPTNAQRLAKQIYHAYDSGVTDPLQIARIILHAESIDYQLQYSMNDCYTSGHGQQNLFSTLAAQDFQYVICRTRFTDFMSRT
ncbi:hypothetical protein L7D45_22205 [Brucella pseudogrignonensis]|uniref:hypothetical protein n=1 Tax=Brucella pseudogrignonensis TaxID=419475 RepID=UPI00190DB41A|nr:hypothetical protein [Brucella pseudogrignonensis]MBK0024492.1 hypothetical protein [Ochrobactrum sp. S45]UKK95392.1 hypothetical protein L7D45_22205 [Brucella pseudogrignonensis]